MCQSELEPASSTFRAGCYNGTLLRLLTERNAHFVTVVIIRSLFYLIKSLLFDIVGLCPGRRITNCCPVLSRSDIFCAFFFHSHRPKNVCVSEKNEL